MSESVIQDILTKYRTNNSLMRVEILVLTLIPLLIQSVQSSNNDDFVGLERIRDKRSLETTDLKCIFVPDKYATWSFLLGNLKAEDMHFYFYSRKNKKGSILQTSKNFSADEIDYDMRKDTAFITHGYWGKGQNSWILRMKDALLKLKDMNVVLVDWSKGSQVPDYISAAETTQIVGFEIAEFIRVMSFKKKRSQRTSIKGQLHLIGHSLGAHASASAAFHINQMNKKGLIEWKVHRITGLDPAHPCFTHAKLSVKLDRGDAYFVDVIHSNALHWAGLGLREPLGHKDFYPNGGRMQLECGELSDLDFISHLKEVYNTVLGATCSHGFSHELFTASIEEEIKSECKYVGHQWDGLNADANSLITGLCETGRCPEMGINAVRYMCSEGTTFYVPTGNQAPYCDFSKEDKKAMGRQLEWDRIHENNIIPSRATEKTSV